MAELALIAVQVVALAVGAFALLLIAAQAYYRYRFLGHVVRIFEEKPFFVIPRGLPEPGAEDVHFPAADGLALRGCYLTARGPRKGVIMFGLEYGSNRWSAIPYCGALRDAGYDVFAYEPRNQGESEKDPTYTALQWVTDRDLADGRAAVAYLKARDDAPADGIGVFGISKGGCVGLLLAGEDRWVKCVATDGAYATYTTVVPYMRKWVAIYSPYKWLQDRLPGWFYGVIGISAMKRVGAKRSIRFLSVERAVRRMRQPLLMIHGGGDTYIKPEMAKAVFDMARAWPKEFWLVPRAKHNQAIQAAGDAYPRKLVEFFDANMPAAMGSAVLPAVDSPTPVEIRLATTG